MQDLIDKMGLKLCNKVCFAGGMGYGLHQDELIEFYLAAFNDGLKAAATMCSRLEELNNAWHGGGDTCAEAISALEMK